MESYLSEVTETFGLCRGIQHVDGMFQKVALLEILRSLLLPGVQAYSIEFVRF